MHLKSIAILDLETTGLCNPRITELAVVACEREHCIEVNEKVTLPRVAHKLVLCVQPYAKIHPAATLISGLDNEDVMNCKTFEGVIEQLQLFLDRLPQPVCLIAHNGIKFDFSVLRREIFRTNSDKLNGIFCADSLPAFQQILSGNRKQLGNRDRVPAIPPELCNSEEDLICIKAMEQLESEGVLSSPSRQPLSQLTNESTPKSRLLPVSSTPQKRRSASTDRPNNLNVSRNLFGDDEEPKRSEILGRPRTYKLKDIYEFLHGSQFPDAHRAENDAVALMECVVRVGERFFNWVDEHSVLFTDL